MSKQGRRLWALELTGTGGKTANLGSSSGARPAFKVSPTGSHTMVWPPARASYRLPFSGGLEHWLREGAAILSSGSCRTNEPYFCKLLVPRSMSAACMVMSPAVRSGYNHYNAYAALPYAWSWLGLDARGGCKS